MPTAFDERVESVAFSDDFMVVGFKDGRRISVPVEWYPRLVHASEAQRSRWEINAGGYGIHWPELNEDLSTEGLLRGAPAPNNKPQSACANRMGLRGAGSDFVLTGC